MTLTRKDFEKAAGLMSRKSSSPLTSEERGRIIREAIESSEGKEKLGMAMAGLIRDRLHARRYAVPCCPRCGMPEDQYAGGRHTDEECTVYRVMES
jgi:hypothetical protein